MPASGQQQAKLYADCLEKQFGQRPIIFYSNGYEHWIWDDQNYPPRSVQGFLHERRVGAADTAAQHADRRWVRPRSMKASWSGSTRNGRFGALARLRERPRTQSSGRDGNWRGQDPHGDCAVRPDDALQLGEARPVPGRPHCAGETNDGVFKRHLPSASAVNAMEHPEQIGEARVLVSTYPTMLRLIDETKDGRRKFGPGHFDLVVIDEAHRSVYQKYRAIFEYFDSSWSG